MNSKHQKTLAAIFSNAKSLPYRNVESLLKALGCDKIEGDGSRVRFRFSDDVSLYIHKPHPAKEILEYQIKAVRSFLNDIGVMP